MSHPITVAGLEYLLDDDGAYEPFGQPTKIFPAVRVADDIPVWFEIFSPHLQASKPERLFAWEQEKQEQGFGVVDLEDKRAILHENDPVDLYSDQ